MTIEEYIKENHPESTAKTYLYYIDHFTSIHKDPLNMSHKEIVEYFDELDKRGKSQGNRRVMLNAIKRYYDYVCDVLQYRDDHPCERMILKGARTKEVMLNNIFTIEELSLLLDRKERYKLLEKKNKLIITFMIYQGLAPAEISNMKVSDVDIDSGCFTARGTEKIKRRRLELEKEQFGLIFKYLNERDSLLKRTGLKSDHLFITHFGTEQTVDSINRMFRSSAAMFPDKKLNPQNIRMSVIYNMVNNKQLRLEQALELSGLKWMSSISKYLQADKEGDMKIIEDLHPFRDVEI